MSSFLIDLLLSSAVSAATAYLCLRHYVRKSMALTVSSDETEAEREFNDRLNQKLHIATRSRS